jgi:hypothetical protein
VVVRSKKYLHGDIGDDGYELWFWQAGGDRFDHDSKYQTSEIEMIENAKGGSGSDGRKQAYMSA